MVIAKDVFAGIWLAYLLAWALAILTLVVIAVVLIISRGPSNAARKAFRRAVAASARGDSLHTAGQAPLPAGIAAAIRTLRAADPQFDATAFLDGARIAVGAYAMARAAQDDRLLRRITTPGYWHTPIGSEVANVVAEWRRHAGERSGTTNPGRVLLDLSWREPQIREVRLGEQGMDRITVRLGSVMVGAIRATWQRIEGAEPGWQRLDGVTQLDWDFVRPARQRTEPGAVMLPRTCPACGAPYHSDLDACCPYCHTARPDTQAGWRLDRTYLVVNA